MIYAIIGIVVALVLVIGIVLLCVSKLKLSVNDSGEEGERIVAEILGDNIDGKQYVINDLIFCTDGGQSCQIDHIFINRCGIWVIETKNYSGTIFGNETAREWTQCLADGKIANKFYNPIKQNVTHIFRLAEYLNIRNKNLFQNVVVFLNKADISKIESTSVYSSYDLESIKSTETGMDLSVEQMKLFYNKLLDLKTNHSISKSEHVKNIRNMQKALQKGICPRCGAKLVLRNGEYGEFYGCSNYPTCKFTKNKD